MRSKTEVLRPERIAQILEENAAPNRNLRQSWINELARRIKNGEWKEHHQGIAFDEDGKFIDGQNRLLAMLEALGAGESIRVRVTYGVPRGSMVAVEDGKGRTLFDVAKLNGVSGKVSLTPNHASTARFIIFAARRFNSSLKPSKPECLEFMKKHMLRIDFGVRCVRAKPKKGLTTIPICAVVARALSDNGVQLERFCRIYATGIPDEAFDLPALLLRNMMLYAAMRKVMLPQKVVYRKCERAVKAFLERQAIKTLYEAKEELFPLEDEPKWARA